MQQATFITTLFVLFAHLHPVFPGQTTFHYDDKIVSEVNITVRNASPAEAEHEKEKAKQLLQIKPGKEFSQQQFDQDLKALHETGDYAEVIPEITSNRGQLNVHIYLKMHPTVDAIIFTGNNDFKTKILRRKFGIKRNSLFKREEVQEKINELHDYLIKKGYYTSRIDYTTEPSTEDRGVILKIHVYEGPQAHIKKIIFHGFSPKEEKELRQMIQTKKHNFLSFLTGHGIHNKETLDTDKNVVVNFLQDRGYADATVNIYVEKRDNKLELVIECDKGQVYHIRNIEFTGNKAFSDKELSEQINLRPGSIFSPEKIRATSEAIRKYYTKHSHIDTTVQYKLSPSPLTSEYNVLYEIQESPQYKVGMIIIRGNHVTKKTTLLQHVDLVPGEYFDSSKLETTQMNLMSLGFFKSVSVYAVKSPNDTGDHENYRNVIVEVEETSTGNASAFVGASSTQNVFGGIDLIENNFNIEGLTNWSRGFSGLRGGGQFLQLRLQIGEKEKSYNISWLDPHFMETSWQFGFDATYSRSNVQSDAYSIHTFNFSTNASHPLARYWRILYKARAKNTLLHQDDPNVVIPSEEFANSGVITGFGSGLMYDSRDNAYRPRKGIYSLIEGNLNWTEKKKSSEQQNGVFPFLKLSYLNSLYYPVWEKGTVMGRVDLKFLQAFTVPTQANMPMGERFFMGGVSSVRGYRPASIGDKFLQVSGEPSNAAEGGVSSFLFSMEYIQNLFKTFDAFVFFDSGAISQRIYRLSEVKMSYGAGIRFDISRGAPFILGYGIPINPDSKDQEERFFFSFGGQF